MAHAKWFVGVLLLAGAGTYACRDQPGGNTTSPGETPAEPLSQANPDSPVRLDYVCDNRFLVANARRVPVTVTYVVQGSNERGERHLVPAPAGDPPFSETELVTETSGAVELYLNDTLMQVRANEGVACTPTVAAPSFAVTGASSAGQWTAPLTWPNVAVHLHLLWNGKVLSWGKTGDPYVWDPATRASTRVPASSWLFCAGHAFLPDGRLLVAGGHISDDHGLPDANIFSPRYQTWTRVPSMRWGRWYPTTTTLANGEVLTIAGRDQSGLTVRTPEVWTGSSWRALTGAAITLPYYPRTFLAPNGRVFYAGELHGTRYLNPSGSGSWTFVANRLYGTRDYGAAVMYEPGKIVYVGGGRTTNTAEIIDLNQAAPAWRWTGSMAYPRRHLNATVLPTGEVLVTGGSRGTTFNDVTRAVRAAEIWNPATGVWTTLASGAVDRTYHATSILLPDGRVLHAGSGDALLADGTQAPAQRNAELFSPPYLFRGTRPTISSVPSSIYYGQTFLVSTPQASSISTVTLIASGSTTHAFDMSQRFTRLTFTRTSGGLNARAPSSRNLAPPGFYLLFVLNGDRVPSVAKIVQLR